MIFPPRIAAFERSETQGDVPIDIRPQRANGVPDEQFGQRLKAWIVLRAGATTSEDSLRAYLRERIARFKLPREFVFVRQLPRNALNKVVKSELEQLPRL